MDTAIINLPLGFQGSDMTNSQEAIAPLRFPNPFNTSSSSTFLTDEQSVLTGTHQGRIGEFVWHSYSVWQARRDVNRAYKRINRSQSNENI